ncbi:MAG: SURF1 family protein [Lysobacter sp.]|nr:SURF1 family protein [Lysobacter sp.]
MRRHPVLLWAFALVAIAGFASLGVWQLGRADIKRGMLAEAQRALSARAPQPAGVIGDAARANAYDWIEVHGRFVDAPAVLLDNQQHEGRVGVRAYRSFETDAGQGVLVDLGWVALPLDRTLPQVPRDDAPRALRGLLLPPPGAGLRLGEPQPQSDGTLLAMRIEPAELARMLGVQGLAPRVLRPEPGPGFGYQRDFDILPNTLPPEKHLGYAVQWFALAAAVLATAVLLTVRRSRRLRSINGPSQ